MFHLKTAIVVVVAAFGVQSALAAVVIPLCTGAWQTSQATGVADTATSIPKTCTTAATCTGPMAVNPKCQKSYKTNTFICCYDILPTIITMATPDSMSSTYATPVTPITPQNFKPKCPNGAPSVGGGSQVLVCNPTQALNCPQGYTCTKAENVYDAYGTPQNPSDDLGAVMNPYLCCLTTALTNYGSVFTTAGLSPSIVPVPPTSGLQGVMLGSGMTISTGENWSPLTGQLTKLIVNVTLSSPTTPGAFYHIIYFDSTTNKELCMQVNIMGMGGQGVGLDSTMMALPTNETQPGGGCVVYDTAAKGNYSYKTGAAYTFKKSPPTATAHTWVVLVYMTYSQVVTEIADVSSSMFNFNDATKRYGDLVPTGTSTATTSPKGLYTTVSALLTSKGGQLGTPIAGSYFYLST